MNTSSRIEAAADSRIAVVAERAPFDCTWSHEDSAAALSQGRQEKAACTSSALLWSSSSRSGGAHPGQRQTRAAWLFSALPL